LQIGKLLLLFFFFFFFFFSFPEEALNFFVTVVTSAFPSQFGFCEFDKYSLKEFVFCILRIGFVCEGLMFFLHMKDFFFCIRSIDVFVHEGNVILVYEGL
jgi:hypothetical protein